MKRINLEAVFWRQLAMIRSIQVLIEARTLQQQQKNGKLTIEWIQ
jgi:hypothetical protein